MAAELELILLSSLTVTLTALLVSPTGSRIASWLPSFSVEVMHTTNVLGIAQANNSQLNAMVRVTFSRTQVLTCKLMTTFGSMRGVLQKQTIRINTVAKN